MIKKMVVTPALFFLLLMSLCGCTAGLAMQGLSSGSPVAFNATGRGKGDSAWFARYDDVVQATLRAGEKLSFKLEKKTLAKIKVILSLLTPRGRS